MAVLNEDSRLDLINKSKASTKGNQRYKRRTKSRIANSVREFNSIDMNKLFKDGILSVNINVTGETSNYIVRISFGGFLDILHDELERNNDKLELKVIVRTLLTGFGKKDVYINCSCPDFYYRFGYYATVNQINTAYLDNRSVKWKDKAFAQGISITNYSGVGDPQNIPSKITNPYDTLGSACKHVLLVLSNNSWLLKVASVINNYIKYMEKSYQRVYADVIYPAIYQRSYEDEVQLDIFDKGRKYAPSSKKVVGASNNIYTDRDSSGKFIKGNDSGIRFEPKPQEIEQIPLFVDEDIVEEEQSS